MANTLFSENTMEIQEKNSENPYEEIVRKRIRPKSLKPATIFDQIEEENNTSKTDTIIDLKTTSPSKPKNTQPQVEYSYEEVVAEAKKYFNGDELAANVWANKYALKNATGSVFYEHSPEQMHRRLAKEFARIEKKYPNPMSEEEIFQLIKGFKYIIPQGSPMSGVGNNQQIVSLSNCFVIGEDISDSYGGIMKIDQEQVQLMKRRGGVGHDLSHIRPRGSKVKNSALTSTGIVPFMERYSNSTREVAQDGRRGALMLSISVEHPDAGHFIDAKMESGKVTGANISVKLTDKFMKAVIDGTNFTQQYPVESSNPTVVKEVDARQLWEKIVHNAWASAEPGIMFWDTIINESLPDTYADLGFKTTSTNPCGEIPLCPYDSCRLMALNLYGYVEEPYTKNASFNLDLFADHVQKAQRLMDDLIDLETEKIDAILEKIEKDPESEEVKRVERKLWETIRDKTLKGRRTGLGITAEGDMLAALGTRYGSEEAINFSVQVHKNLALEAYRSSVIMAKERGAFPIYNAAREVNNPLVQRINHEDPALYQEMKKTGRRNIALLTIAPTGSVSICTQTSSGIEPVFRVSYKRRRKVNPNDNSSTVSFVDELGDNWEEYNVMHHGFTTWLQAQGYDINEIEQYNEEQINELIIQSPYHLATANDINWVQKVKMQGAVQKWVDHSISVTVNLPRDAEEELISDIYKTAWESGCKGMTVYRDGSRDGVLVSVDKEKECASTIIDHQAPPRKKRIEAEVIRFQNDYEKWIAFVGIIDDRPYEIFTGNADGFIVPSWVKKGWINKSKSADGISQYDFEFEDKHGYIITQPALSRSFNKEYWNYAKLISGILRHGMPLPRVVDLISGLSFDSDAITNWKAGVERALKRFIPDGEKPKKTVCPKCSKDSLIYQEGCLVCSECGYSKCG